MFSNLSEKLSKSLQKLRGQARISEENIQEALREVRVALLDADVALPVVTQFIDEVRNKALGQDVLTSLDPSKAFIKIVNDELTHIMGDECAELNLAAQPPAVVLLAGLQGSGKTTTTAKLALWLKETLKKKVLVVSTDIYRPAAIEQLKTLAESIDVGFHPSTVNDKPVDIANAAISAARKQFYDVVLVDTAGRLHIDDEMMAEIKAIHAAINPIETLFVVDSMTGQDAANTAKAFNEVLPLTGVILTKTDGDARGGAALSIRYITQAPIKFIGAGEKTDALEPFYPDRIASRILGMGDILSLVEEAERKIDKKKADKLTKKFKKGQGFDFDDFLTQIEQMQNMGGMMGIMSKLPGLNQIPKAAQSQLDDKNFIGIKAIIHSMTTHERQFPKVLNGSRKRRIAAGAGRSVPEINKLLRQFEQMQKMMKKMARPGAMKKMMRNMPPGMAGKLPGNMDDLM